MGLPGLRRHLSIRTKLVLLVASVISASLALDIYLGSSLLFEDKISYIYDANSTGLKAASDAIESRIQESVKVAALLGALTPAQSPPALKSAIESYLALPRSGVRFSGMAFLRARDRAHFTVEGAFGKSNPQIQEILDRLGWSPELFERSQVLLGEAKSGEISVGAKCFDAQNAPIALLTFMTLESSVIQDLPSEASIYILDSQGKIVSSRTEARGAMAPEKLLSLVKLLPENPDASGTHFWKSEKSGWLVSYRKFGQGKLLLLSVTPQSLAMEAAYSLVQRSILLGLGLLAIALGTALLWAHGMVQRLNQLWQATQRVALGDFSFRVKEKATQPDELSHLAASFNLMSTRITGLIAETVEKARMASELETAQAFQKGFFPEEGFRSADLLVAGKYVPASECAGDWWHFAKIHGRLILVMGDVTGHGASAAMLTAVVQGAYSQWVETHRIRPEAAPDLSDLLQCLNSVFFQSGRGRSLMTFLAISIDLQTGFLEMASASHLNPYLYRRSEGTPGGAFNSIFPLVCTKSSPLGLSKTISVQKSGAQLQAGDRIFAFTDGFKDGNNGPENQPLNKRHLLKLLQSVFENGSADADTLCLELLTSRLGPVDGPEHSQNLSDDMTILVAAVQANSQWGTSAVISSQDVTKPLVG